MHYDHNDSSDASMNAEADQEYDIKMPKRKDDSFTDSDDDDAFFSKVGEESKRRHTD